MHCRDVQQPGNAELNAADLRKPSADAEHAVCSLHAQYDAVTGSKPRVGLPGMKQKHVRTHINTCAYTHQTEDTHTYMTVVMLECKFRFFKFRTFLRPLCCSDCAPNMESIEYTEVFSL